MAEEALTIRQAAALLNVHPNTVRNRIKSGKYKADKVITEHGETYLIPRSELMQETSTNNVVSPTPTQSPSQPITDVREAMQAMLEPFVRELGDVREELGRERERREQLQHERDELRRELDALREVRGSPVSPGPSETTPDTAEGPQTATETPPAGDARRPWWRRVFGG